MKKFLAFVMAASMALSLAACGGSSASTATSTTTEATSEAAASTSGSKTDVAFVTDVGNIDDQSFNQYTWQGVQDFCSANSLNANYYRPTEDSDAARLEQMDNAVNDGAKSIVVAGYLFGNAIAEAQEKYPDVQFLALDVSASDLGDKAPTANTALITYKEEQAGYLAGYAAVYDGYKELGFLGGMAVPAVIRYGYGFVQGAEAAAELQGEYVTLQTWFTDTYENNDAITQRMIDWYNNGTSLIMVSGGNLYEGVSGAVNQTGGKAITTDYDNTELGDRVLGSAIKCYNAAVQRQLYTFFAAGTWNGQTGGQTEKASFTNGEVALVAGAPWRFDSFTQDDYRTLYEELRTSVLKVDAYSDLDTLPETPNVTVNRLP